MFNGEWPRQVALYRNSHSIYVRLYGSLRCAIALHEREGERASDMRMRITSCVCMYVREMYCSVGAIVACMRKILIVREKMRSYLVDSASSHMLVSKIKPCMSKYMPY